MIIPLSPIRILGQTTMVDIAPTSQYGSKTDVAVIRTQLLIENDGEEKVLPLAFLATDPNESDPPTVRFLDEKRQMNGRPSDEVDTQTLIDQAVAAAAQTGVPADVVRTSLGQVIEKAMRHHKTYVTLKPNQRLMLEFVSRERLQIDPATRTVGFTTLAPLPQYQLAAGGTLWLCVALPRPLAGLNVNLVNSTQEFNRVETDIHGRKLIAWQWQNDPLLTVSYQYS